MTFSLDIAETDAGQIHLAVVLDDDDAVWPHPNRDDPGSDFDPEDVVSWLADAWPYLLLEQSWPVRFQADQEPHSITGLLRAAEDRWESFGSGDTEEVAAESALVDAFLYAHDLSQMKPGAGLQACFVLRQHTKIRIETSGRVREDVDFRAFISQLAGLGTAAVKLLRKRPGDSAARLIERWRQRDQIAPLDAAALVSGLPRSEIEASPDLSLPLVEALENRTLSQIANDNNAPIPAAARASGVLGTAGLVEVLHRIKTLPDGNIKQIGFLRRELKQALRDLKHPLDQGIRAASFVRGWLKVDGEAKIDLADLCNRLGIRVERQIIPDNRLDGIATIGPWHGPAIMLNENTRRQGAGPDDLERSLRFTWAHEIGHLLLDYDEWAALIDATRQRVSRSVETRANAFAAYLLLPPNAACRAWELEGSPLEWTGLEQLLNRLTANFGLPRIAASRQLARAVPYDRRKALEQVFRARIANFDSR